MASGEVIRILPQPSHRHRQPPPPPPHEEELKPQQQQQRQNTEQNLQQQQHQHQHQQQQQQQQRQKSERKSQETQNQPEQWPQTNSENDGISKLQNAQTSMSTSGVGLGADFGPRQSNDLSYMHRPPTILPNYGKKTRGALLPKSNVTRVLLYDNMTQQSMLDVRINSMKSQSYKTNRELDMHMKSFISRRKAKDKALKKITKVKHLDDYSEFIQEQQQQQQQEQNPSAGLSLVSAADCIRSDNKFMLPRIRSHQTMLKSKTLNKPFGSEVGFFHNASHQKCHSTPSTGRTPILNTSLPAKQEAISLPKISLSTATQKPEESENESRRVSLRFVKSDQGVTRLFQVVPETEESSETTANAEVENSKDMLEFQNNINDKDENNNSLSLTLTTMENMEGERNVTTTSNGKPYRKPRASIFQLRRKREEELLQQLQSQEKQPMNREDSVDIPTSLHPDKPLIDSRFLHLRRLLVPQDPPNEGFTELSPSFPKRYPSLKDLSPRSRRKKIEQGRRYGTDNNTLDSELSDSEGFLDSSDDDV